MKPISNEEIEKYRALFPVTQKWVYLNHAAVAPISLKAVQAVEEFNRDALNEGYTAGPHWVKRFREVREAAARLCGATPEEIAFVKNTSHGLSLIARGLDLQAGDEVILSDLEFPTNVYPWMALEKRGIVIKKLHSHGGALRLEDLEKLVHSGTKVISLSSVQYGSGYRLPLSEIGKLCRDLGIHFFVDAIQSLGAFPLDVGQDKIDFLAADAHKWMLGHEGIGILYVRKPLIEKIEPALLGWNSVHNPYAFDVIDFTLRKDAERFEEGSHNGMSIYSLGAAIDLLLEVGIERIAQRLILLTDILISGLQELGLSITNPLQTENRSGIVTFRFNPERYSKNLGDLERHLYARKYFVSLRQGSLRVSPHFYNTEAEIQGLLSEIKSFLA